MLDVKPHKTHKVTKGISYVFFCSFCGSNFNKSEILENPPDPALLVSYVLGF